MYRHCRSRANQARYGGPASHRTSSMVNARLSASSPSARATAIPTCDPIQSQDRCNSRTASSVSCRATARRRPGSRCASAYFRPWIMASSGHSLNVNRVSGVALQPSDVDRRPLRLPGSIIHSPAGIVSCRSVLQAGILYGRVISDGDRCAALHR